MKIAYIVIDELPESCRWCQFSNRSMWSPLHEDTEYTCTVGAGNVGGGDDILPRTCPLIEMDKNLLLTK